MHIALRLSCKSGEDETVMLHVDRNCRYFSCSPHTFASVRHVNRSDATSTTFQSALQFIILILVTHICVCVCVCVCVHARARVYNINEQADNIINYDKCNFTFTHGAIKFCTVFSL